MSLHFGHRAGFCPSKAVGKTEKNITAGLAGALTLGLQHNSTYKPECWRWRLVKASATNNQGQRAPCFGAELLQIQHQSYLAPN